VPPGKELLASATFTEPRAKGATLRGLKNFLGADVTIEDSTTTTRRPRKPVPPIDAIPAKTAGVGAKSAAKETAAGVRPRPSGQRAGRENARGQENHEADREVRSICLTPRSTGFRAQSSLSSPADE
jgi:hypothetical protein